MSLYDPIEPFISPVELKEYIDEGMNWVPIPEAAWPSFVSTYKQCNHGYDAIQRVGWIYGREKSPNDLGIPSGIILVPSIEDQGNIVPSMHAITTWYGLKSESGRRSSKFIKEIIDSRAMFDSKVLLNPNIKNCQPYPRGSTVLSSDGSPPKFGI